MRASCSARWSRTGTMRDRRDTACQRFFVLLSHDRGCEKKSPHMAEKITPRAQDFSQWYQDVVLQAKLADYSPVKGCMVIRPNGYSIWEQIQRNLDARIKKTGVRNAYFP